MKIRNRETNIFSMSALDLFASAMGAFLLLTVVSLPFFANTSRLDDKTLIKKLEQRKKELETERQRREEAESKAQEATAALSRIKLPDLDIVILLDITGSMGAQIRGLKQEVSTLATVFSRISPSIRFGVITFGDRLWTRPVVASELSDILRPDGLSKLKEFLQPLEANYGCGVPCPNPDDPEAVFSAIQAAEKLPWRSASTRKIVLVITDNPAYAEEVSPSLAFAEAFRAQGGGREISAVLVGDVPAGAQYLEELVKRGGGRFIRYEDSISASILDSLL
jgi:hypothetical protein